MAKCAGLRLPKQPFEEKFADLHAVRNSVAHAGAELRITKDETGARRAAERLGFPVTGAGTIEIDLEVCQQLAEEGRAWINELHHAAWPALRDGAKLKAQRATSRPPSTVRRNPG